MFWLSLVATVYPYAIYPALLAGWNKLAGRHLPVSDHSHRPRVTIICPLHNEADRIVAKIRNLLALDYPAEKLQIVLVGDGCTDRTLDLARLEGCGRIEIIALQKRGGKAAALNAGLTSANGDILVFTDAGIALEPKALVALAGHFADRTVGCVSGEDSIEGGGAEGLYGRFELGLRREEAKLHSIAGASGCLYAIRRSLCRPFRPAMAPDFLSVLDTVRAGYRAICEPLSRGSMTATVSRSAEYARKTRTFLRGITALFGNMTMLNPFRYPAFSFILVSHKLLRWLVPIALAGCFVASLLLRDQLPYRIALYLQLVLYVLAAAGIAMPRLAASSTVIRICVYFLLVNLAAALALCMWLLGRRQEVWEPTRRPA